MRRMILGLSTAAICFLIVTSAVSAQTAPSAAATPAPVATPTGPTIIVVGKDPAHNADQQIPFYTTFVGGVASDWARDFGWGPPKSVTVNLYTNGIIMAADSGFYSVTPLTIDRLLTVANQPTVAVRDRRPVGPGGGNGTWLIGVNVNYTGTVSAIGATEPPTETQGFLVHDLAAGMLEDVGGTGGPQWFREGLADLLANSRVHGLNEVNQRSSAWFMANGSGVLATVTTITQDWPGVTSTPGLIRESSLKVADQAVFFLAQKFGVPALVGILQRTSAGEDFQTVLQSVTGYNLEQLDAAYKVTMPLY